MRFSSGVAGASTIKRNGPPEKHMDSGLTMRLKFLHSVRLELYLSRKQPSNFTDESNMGLVMTDRDLFFE